MLRRGQKVIIIKSSAINNRHPKAGDIGYLNNAFIYPAYKFILVEIMFCQYKEDVRKGRDRLERKKFIIDLGMPKTLKYKLSRTSVEKGFFVNNNHQCVQLFITNTNVVTLNDDQVKIVSHINSPTYGLWSKSTDPHHKVRIPVGQLASFNTISNRKYSLIDCSMNEFIAWFKCMRTLIYSLLILPPDGQNSIRFVSKTANRIYSRERDNGKRLDAFMSFDKNDHLNLRPTTLLSAYDRKSIIESIQYFNSLMSTLLNRLDKKLINIVTLKGRKNDMQRQWAYKGLNGLKEINMWNIIRTLFLHALLTNGDSSSKFKALNDLLPSNLSREYNIQKINDIKLAGCSNSAALNRFYKENYIT